MDNLVLAKDKKVSFYTMGCRLNIAETGAFTESFIKNGFEVVPFSECANVVLINTCTVTDKADSSCRNIIRKAKKNSPDGKIVVVGCYAQIEGDSISEKLEVDLVLGTNEKNEIFDYLYVDKVEDKKTFIDGKDVFYPAATSEQDSHTRAFLKIQDGCNYFCSYCIIPYARGRARGSKINETLDEAKKLIRRDYKEIILTGVNIGEYGNKKDGARLSNLVEKLVELPKLKRLRISSIEPNTINDELINLFKRSNILMKHIHIPLQSGDDKILKLMGRRYTTSFFKELVLRLKKEISNLTIGTDIITGHPGEDEESFNRTYSFIRDLPITHLHTFSYSKRAGTKSEKLDDQVPKVVKKERTQKLIELGKLKMSEFMRGEIGKNESILFELSNDLGFFEGYSSNFIKVKVQTDIDLKNQIKNVIFKKSNQEFIEGVLA